MTEMPQLQFEPAFVEETVFLFILDAEKENHEEIFRPFYEERERIYNLRPAGEKEGAFRAFNGRFFEAFGLKSFFEDIVREFPLLAEFRTTVLFRRVWSRKEEGVELYVEGTRKTVLTRLQAARVLEPKYLITYLRHEFLHVSDMLDPGFQYIPHPELGGQNEMEDNLIRDRFRILWDLYVSGRLHDRGKALLVPLEKQKAAFEKAFLNWNSEARNRIFDDLISGRRKWTQKKLIQLAQDHRLTLSLGEGGLRCPVCGFSSFGQANLDELSDKRVVRQIELENSGWRPELGICQQCFELYQARPKVSV